MLYLYRINFLLLLGVTSLLSWNFKVHGQIDLLRSKKMVKVNNDVYSLKTFKKFPALTLLNESDPNDLNFYLPSLIFTTGPVAFDVSSDHLYVVSRFEIAEEQVLYKLEVIPLKYIKENLLKDSVNTKLAAVVKNSDSLQKFFQSPPLYESFTINPLNDAFYIARQNNLGSISYDIVSSFQNQIKVYILLNNILQVWGLDSHSKTWNLNTEMPFKYTGGFKCLTLNSKTILITDDGQVYRLQEKLQKLDVSYAETGSVLVVDKDKKEAFYILQSEFKVNQIKNSRRVLKRLSF